MKKTTGGPVFPQPATVTEGMHMRDAFALAALPGVMRIAVASAAAGQGFTDDASIATQAYKIADEMLIARAI